MMMLVIRRLLSGLCVVGLGLGGAACGDDEAAKSSKPKKNKPKNNRKAAAAEPVAEDTSTYPKVDEGLRHVFADADFVPDSAGETNRDPFRSWVLKPKLEAEVSDEPQAVDVCTKAGVRWGAESYSVRDIDLVGLVKRGRSYAQFTDRSDTDSWIVRKGDCIGQEKAIIEEIGVGYVRLSITPDAPPGSPAPKPQKQDISLHPDELELPSAITDNFGD